METIINVDDVSFSYGTQTEQVLKHISLGVNRGDFIGIIGPSGAGKSTLAACLSGAVPHHYTGTFFGSVTVDGNDTCEVSLTDVSQIVGSVLQDIDTQMVASVVEDEMLFGLENFGVPHDQIEQRVSETLETVGISDLRDREIATLSGGQKQKVAIAAILAMRPRVLVLDEPTAALDPASSTLVKAVQDHIDPDSQGLGMGEAPIGAYCYVSAATGFYLPISLQVTALPGSVQTEVTQAVKDAVTAYLTSIAFRQDYVSYAQIAAAILSAPGVEDFANLTVNGGTANIAIADRKVAVLGEVTVTYAG